MNPVGRLIMAGLPAPLESGFHMALQLKTNVVGRPKASLSIRPGLVLTAIGP